MKKFLFALSLAVSGLAHADAVDTLRAFVAEVKTGRTDFTQTVSSPDGKRVKTSSGSFEFQRPNRFRFVYQKPSETLIVADGQKVWMYDPDLQQASSRKMDKALGATPAALLAGNNLERDFTLKAEGADTVLAMPRQADGTLQSLRIRFKGKALSSVEIVDGFGQKSLLNFGAIATNVPLAPERFRFTAPAGVDVIEQ
ncbi:MAG: outer membrane lipoprotein chaperone LolA [Paucibacter sp.]|nr:outer membrane lipoprotein chaperone LolA [Roseateles sp.]